MYSVHVIDDDASLRRTVSLGSDPLGYRVTEAADAENALHGMERRASDIALCDVGMASHDGVWLAWRLRERHPQTAIIVATALRDCETAVSSLRNDVVDYLLKPFDHARLHEALSLARDWHVAAAGDEALHQALQDRLRTRRAELAAALAEAQTTRVAALDGLISMLQLHERGGRGHATRVARAQRNRGQREAGIPQAHRPRTLRMPQPSRFRGAHTIPHRSIVAFCCAAIRRGQLFRKATVRCHASLAASGA